MPTVLAGSSVSLTLLESEQLTISTTGGKGSVTVSPNGGTAVSHVFTGSAEVLNVGPIDDGGKVGITAVGAPIVYRSGSGSLVTLDSAGTSLVSGDGTTIVGIDALRQSDGYHFHGFAPNQINSDLKFYDYSGALNDGTFQAQLTAANAWANAGFLTQADPSGVGNLWLVALPALTFDYLAGDSLFIFWRGMATPEGGNSPLMGNTSGTSANGIRVVVSSAGKLQVNAYQASGALSRFGGTSTATVFEAATAHSFALAIDGVTGKHCYWADGVRDAAYSSGFLTFGSGGIIDTASSTTLKLGGDGATSGSVQLGVACRTQSLVILEGRNGLGTPAVADLDLLVANLHRNPQKLVLASAW